MLNTLGIWITGKLSAQRSDHVERIIQDYWREFTKKRPARSDFLPNRLDASAQKNRVWRKFWFQRKPFHFEVLLRKRKHIETALHLEADKKTNRSVYGYFRKRWKAVRKSLGIAVKMGRWGNRGLEARLRMSAKDRAYRGVCETGCAESCRIH